MNILLIAGHGAGDPGAVSRVKGKSYREADLTREVAERVQAILKQYANVSVYPTERNAYSDYLVGKLNTYGNIVGQDYVLEIHFNAYSPDAGNGKIKGTEAYVTTSEAGITVEEKILKNLAELGYTNRGVKRKNWGVITAVKKQGISSCLLEVCFLDDGDDMALYEKKKQQTAQAIAMGIVSGFGLGKQQVRMTAEEAIVILSGAGIIDTPDYWMAHYGDVRFLEELLIRMAEYIQ